MSEKVHLPQLELGPSNFTPFETTLMVPCNDPYFEGGKYLGEQHPLEMKMQVHPNNSGRIMVIVPGLGGSIDGYNNKYLNIANRAQSSNLAAVIRTRGSAYTGYLPDIEVEVAMALALQNAKTICGSDHPDIYLVGFSAGAGGVAAVAPEYPQVKKILLIAPGFNMPKKQVQKRLGQFEGEVYVIQGQQDEMVGNKTGPECYEFAKNASRRELFMVPNCSHQFVGPVNGQLMADSVFYSFSNYEEKMPFPSPTKSEVQKDSRSQFKKLISRLLS